MPSIDSILLELMAPTYPPTRINFNQTSQGARGEFHSSVSFCRNY